jgi:predicted DNA-binding protein (UPF0251 family)
LIRQLCIDVLTVKQLEAVKLKAAGAGTRQAARILGIAPASYRDRLSAARLKLLKALDERGMELPVELTEVDGVESKPDVGRAARRSGHTDLGKAA